VVRYISKLTRVQAWKSVERETLDLENNFHQLESRKLSSPFLVAATGGTFIVYLAQ
jgi:hypothetical protein